MTDAVQSRVRGWLWILPLGLVLVGGGQLVAEQSLVGSRGQEARVLLELETEGHGLGLEELAGEPCPPEALKSLRRLMGLARVSPAERNALRWVREGSLSEDPHLESPERIFVARDAAGVVAGLDKELQRLLQEPRLASTLTLTLSPEGRQKVDLDDGFLLPTLEFAQDLAGAAALFAVEGDARAWRLLRQATQLAQRLDEPTLMGVIIKDAMLVAVCEAAPRLLARLGAPSPREGRILEAALESLDRRVDFARALRFELAWAMTLLPSAEQGPAGQGLGPPRVRDWIPFVGKVAYGQERVEYVTLMARAVRAVEAEPRRAQELLAAISSDARAGDRLAQTLVLQIDQAVGSALITRARVRMLRLALRLAACPQLPALLPDPILGDVTSPHSAPVRWERATHRAGRLWCVGLDARDDGGVPDQPGSRATGDLVFEVELPER
jgi:hypothetical protein